MADIRRGLRPTVAAVTALTALSWCGLAPVAFAEEPCTPVIVEAAASEELSFLVEPEGNLGNGAFEVRDGKTPDARDFVTFTADGPHSLDETPVEEGPSIADFLTEPMSPDAEVVVSEVPEDGAASEETSVLQLEILAEEAEGISAVGADMLPASGPLDNEADAAAEEEAEKPTPVNMPDGLLVEPEIFDQTVDDGDIPLDSTVPDIDAVPVPSASVADESAVDGPVADEFFIDEVASEQKDTTADVQEPCARVRTGWVEEDGRKYYLGEDGQKLTGPQLIDGSWFYFDPSKGGAMATGLVTVTPDDGKGPVVYLQGQDGKRQTGEKYIDGFWFYFDPLSNGAQANDSFVRLTGSYLANGPKTVFYDAAGKMVYGEQSVEGDWYYLDPAGGGARAENRFVYLDGAYLAFGPKTVYYGSDGKMVYGEQEYKGDWYYLDPTRGGERVHDRYILLSGSYLANGPKQVYYGSTGKMLKGLQTVNGEKVYFDLRTGALAKRGWQNPSGLFQVSAHNVVLPSYAYGTGFDYVTPSRIGLDATREECVEAFIGRAYEYLGTPYVWDYVLAPGVGVDCAGLVMQSLYATGMDLGDYNPYMHITDPWHDHDANNMSSDSRFQTVSLNERRRGDLVFYPGHVAIYLGGNQIINAYPPKVMVQSVWAYGTPTVVKRPFV